MAIYLSRQMSIVGVLLLEIISGQKNSTFNLDPDSQSLLDWVGVSSSLQSMTDIDIYILVVENGLTGENGVHEQVPNKWEAEISQEEVNGTIKSSSFIEESIGNFKGMLQLNGNSLGQEADPSMSSDQCNSLAASKESEVKEMNESKGSTFRKHIATSKNGKHLGPKKASGTQVKSNKEGNLSRSTSSQVKQSKNCNGGSASENVTESQGLSASEKSMEQKDIVEQELLMKGPGTFPLERLLPIFQCIILVAEYSLEEEELGHGGLGGGAGDGGLMSDVLLQLSSHCSANFISKGSSSPLEGSTRCRCTVDENMVLKVMLLGHSDSYMRDKQMVVTIAFNHFGEGLIQRMPRCRHGYFHVVNNDYTHWEMYVIGGSASPPSTAKATDN